MSSKEREVLFEEDSFLSSLFLYVCCLLNSRTRSFLFLLGSSFALCVTHKKGIFLLRVCILDDASDLPRDILQFVLQERKERVLEKEPTEKHTSKEREREKREREKKKKETRDRKF